MQDGDIYQNAYSVYSELIKLINDFNLHIKN